MLRRNARKVQYRGRNELRVNDRLWRKRSFIRTPRGRYHRQIDGRLGFVLDRASLMEGDLMGGF
jgi:hypothetical protein